MHRLRMEKCIGEYRYGCDDFINVHFNDRKSNEIYFHNQALKFQSDDQICAHDQILSATVLPPVF